MNTLNIWPCCRTHKVCFPIAFFFPSPDLNVNDAFVGFNEFIGERERANPKSRDPRIALFDEIILSKRNRGRTSIFSGRMMTDFLSDTSCHLWRSAAATTFPSTRSQQNLSGDHNSGVSRSRFTYHFQPTTRKPSPLRPRPDLSMAT